MSFSYSDVLVRDIQRFFAGLAIIIGHRRAGRSEEAMQALKESFEGLMMQSSTSMDQATVDQVIKMCRYNGEFSSEMATALAPLIVQQGELFEEKGDEETAVHSYRQALALYEKAKEESGKVAIMGVDGHIADLRKRVEDGTGE